MGKWIAAKERKKARRHPQMGKMGADAPEVAERSGVLDRINRIDGKPSERWGQKNEDEVLQPPMLSKIPRSRDHPFQDGTLPCVC
jgi:hypothetical protein